MMLESEGYQIQRQVIEADKIGALRDEAVRLSEHRGRACVRDILRLSPMMETLAEQLKPDGDLTWVTVRGLLFDKTAETNWAAAWHQDLTIAVAERKEVNGYSAWSVKDGIPHVQPPVKLLDRMVTVRLHLDPTPEENGALQVLARSHRMGRLDAKAIQTCVARGPSVVCACDEGDVLLMKPLILHASSPSVMQMHRRVIHLEYAPSDALDPCLSWAT